MDFIIKMNHFNILTVILFMFKALSAASVEDKYKPMVAFICEKPAMHREISGWVADKTTDCLSKMEDILAYCKTMYPDSNITNVVEASYLVTIPDWPMVSADRKHPHRVRPFRCLAGGFQSDALLVPQHCEFDHRHNQSQCEGFSYWNIVADDACKKKAMHLESFGMLLNCKLGKFSGVEYVCCPSDTDTNYHPPQDSDKPEELQNSSEEDEDDYAEDDDDDDDNDTEDDNEGIIDLYEAYLRGQDFPKKYNNEHKKFLAAKEKMLKNQQDKVAKLLEEWQAARDHVKEVRKSDPKTADIMVKEISERFQKLYAAYEQEEEADKEQLTSLHLQHVQAALNEKKREAMDKYIKALETGNVAKITKYLQGYIKAEEKDRLHTVNHFKYTKNSSPREAAHIRPLIVNHLRLSEQRIDQALAMLAGYPDVVSKVQPVIDVFMKRFDAIASNIRDIVLAEPQLDGETTESTSQAADTDINRPNGNNNDEDNMIDYSSTEELDTISHDSDDIDDEIHEDEHDYERKNTFFAHSMQDTHHVKQGYAQSAAVSSSHVGSTVGIALGSVSVLVVIIVAIVMLKRHTPRPAVSHGFVEDLRSDPLPPSSCENSVDPSASPEERHLANMQMNGYENPTYKYFEVQNNPKA